MSLLVITLSAQLVAGVSRVAASHRPARRRMWTVVTIVLALAMGKAFVVARLPAHHGKAAAPAAP